jgi:ParB family chromosome partitioning protein
MKLNHWNGKQLAAAIHVGEAKVSRALALLDLPPQVQEQVQNGELSARAAYQISTLGDEAAQKQLAATAATQKLSSETIAKAARQRRGSPKRRINSSRCIFSGEGGWKIVVTASKRGSYDEVEQALLQAVEEVRHYIRCSQRLF